mgnify:CR=1 FL=1
MKGTWATIIAVLATIAALFFAGKLSPEVGGAIILTGTIIIGILYFLKGKVSEQLNILPETRYSYNPKK